MLGRRQWNSLLNTASLKITTAHNAIICWETLAYLPQTLNICLEIGGAVLRAARINQIASYLICAIHRQTKSKRLSVGFTTASTEKHACQHSSTYVNTFDLSNTRPLVLPSSFRQTREEYFYFYIYSRIL